MQYACKSCGEAWEEEPNPAEPLVCCPVCGDVVAQVATPARPAAAVPAMPPGDSYESTMINVAETTLVSSPTPTPQTAVPVRNVAPAAPPPQATPQQAAKSPPPRTHAPGISSAPSSSSSGLAPGEVHDVTTRILPDSDSGGFKPSTPISGSSGGTLSPPPPRSQRSAATAPAHTGGGLAAQMQHLIGKTIGGYKIESMLGVGGMGAVFLAHQMSLDRHVALKILPARFAANAELLARFTREALSAAQLNHHNIVQVYDVGSEGDTHYISMEFVRGDTLGAGVKKDGRMQLDDAAGFVLQTARGLHYAHERGIVHRDIKPGNLMLNEHGIVKIADMGLAKMRGVAEKSVAPGAGGAADKAHDKGAAARDLALDEDLTRHDIAMGTPSYMAPEQARDASSVDARADQYSLGCTLYYLVAGKTPFSANSAVELISKHQHEPPPPLEEVLPNVPGAFGAIIKRMLAKRAEDRYGTLLEVVHELETYLGVESDKGPFTPREQHLGLLDREQKAYYAVPAAKTRKLAILIFSIVLGVMILGSLFGKYFLPAGVALGLFGAAVSLGLITLVAQFIVNGLRTKDYLFRRVRSVFFGMPLTGWIKFFAAALLICAVFLVLGVGAIGCALLGVGLAAAYQVLVVRKLKVQRTAPVQNVQTMLRELRVRGLAEEAVQDFVARFSGAEWEEFFEELFGYEAMLVARSKWATGDAGAKRKKFGTWREPLARWLDGVEEGRKSVREKKQLAKVEAGRLKAEGVKPEEAEKQAEMEATRIIEQDPARKLQERAAEIEGLRGKMKARRSKVGLAFAVVRGVLGFAMAYGAGIAMFHLPDISGGMIGKFTELGFNGTALTGLVTLVCGVALLLSAFSRHVINSLMIFAGAAIVAFGPAVAHGSGQMIAGHTIAMIVGFLLAAGGFVLNILSLLAGKRF